MYGENMRYDCLIIDDEITLAEATNEYLNMFEVKSSYVTTYGEGIKFLEENEVALLLLDINLGNNSGFNLCKEIRKRFDMPVLFISARTNDDDVLMALGVGGDDYIKKPYSLSVLLAKVKAVLKRYGGTKEDKPLQVSNVLAIDNIKIDYSLSRVTIGGQAIKLKAMEFKLLDYLIRNRNKVVTKDELFEKVWGGGIVSDSTLNVHIRHLREKIEQDPNSPKYIKTIWGTGYVFEVETYEI